MNYAMIGLFVAATLGVGLFVWAEVKVCKSTYFTTETGRLTGMLAVGFPIAGLLILNSLYWTQTWDALTTLGLWFLTIVVGTFNG